MKNRVAVLNAESSDLSTIEGAMKIAQSVSSITHIDYSVAYEDSMVSKPEALHSESD